MKIIWTRPASRNRKEQLTYIGRDNATAAYRLSVEIARQVANLALYPEMGRPGRLFGTRELVIGRTPYIVIYRLTGKEIQILALLHGAQQWP